MIIIPIPIDSTPLGAGGAGAVKLPKMSRLDFPSLNPGDLVGVLRKEGSLVPWCAYLYVVPSDADAWWTLSTGERIERYWGFEMCRHTSTKWGARRALRRMISQYRDGVTHEVQQMRL